LHHPGAIFAPLGAIFATRKYCRGAKFGELHAVRLYEKFAGWVKIFRAKGQKN
jgi:hypothetical protein